MYSNTPVASLTSTMSSNDETSNSLTDTITNGVAMTSFGARHLRSPSCGESVL